MVHLNLTRMPLPTPNSPTSQITNCLFCNIANPAPAKPNNLWFQDELVSIFVPNKRPRAFYHFLVIPR